ncbi:ribonuclease HI family protein [Myxococcus sp. CA056]|uniref:ribonuclease HI family protein n=1 Tax=unclassified Myxococcus TaxID=2648731 RepID=UPI00157B49D1|nr:MULTISPECIES: ribonuclease HI family protein [unclassified Myxococcus]NTX12652.1 ribonuclease HI family protein [Myxococcus sp. CA056]NTX33671.1 ribonuclease HI family protein [Myxococcus sp. CA033]NTX57439.1 ribonuclease HI family protein [Myxococcus sp. CA039A]
MPAPSLVDILRHIAREEPLSSTVRTFRGLTRERLGQLLDEAATRLGPPSRADDGVTATSAPASTAVEPSPPSEPLPRVRVYSDGAARGNPGPAGAGAVVTDPEGHVVARLGRFLGTQTNNSAEYQGLLLGLKHAKSMGAREVDVYADSELLIRQLGGQYQVKSMTLRPLFEEARRLLGLFTKVKLHHIPRAKNAEADEMSNRAIDERM